MRVLLTVNCLQLHPLALYSSARSEVPGSVGLWFMQQKLGLVIASLPIRGSVGDASGENNNDWVIASLPIRGSVGRSRAIPVDLSAGK